MSGEVRKVIEWAGAIAFGSDTQGAMGKRVRELIRAGAVKPHG